MNSTGREALFDVLVLLAAGLAHTSYMLGIGVDSLPSLVAGLVLVGAGVMTVVPQRARVPAAVTGALGTVLAGAVVPRYAARAVRPGDTLPLSLLLAGAVLLVTFAIVHLTTFGQRATEPA